MKDKKLYSPHTGAHTQTVERMWGGCKAMMRQQRTMHSKLFETYFPEYMCRRTSGGVGQNAFSNIVKHIIEQYPSSLLLSLSRERPRCSLCSHHHNFV